MPPPRGRTLVSAGGSTRSRSSAPSKATAAKAPAVAQKLFFRVRDEEVPSVMQALAGGLRDPKSKYLPDQQDLMFFAAARCRGLGGAEVIARRLRELGVPGNSVDRLRQTPLFFAAREGNQECASFLVEQRCEVNHRDTYGQSPLFYSVRESHVEMCRLLVDLGACWTTKDRSKNTAIYYAKGEVAVELTRMFDERLACDSLASKALEAGHPNPDGRKAAAGKSTMLARATPRKRQRKSSSADEATADSSSGSGPELREEVSPDADSPLLDRLSFGAEATCRGSERLAQVQAMVAWTRTGNGRWTGADLGPPLPVGPPSPERTFAQTGEYFVCAPDVGDAPRLRELEREFVLDHFDVFTDEPWHGRLGPLDWCRLVNVIESEEMARQAIVSIVAGRTPRHATLQCVHVPSRAGEGGPQPSIVGYVHIVNGGGYLDVSHLKVQRAHQRKGLGSLLMAGTVRWAGHLGVEVRDLRLVVVVRNAPAIALYRALGFNYLSAVQRRDPKGGGVVKWQKMWRPFNKHMDAGGFVRLCEARAATATARYWEISEDAK